MGETREMSERMEMSGTRVMLNSKYQCHMAAMVTAISHYRRREMREKKEMRETREMGETREMSERMEMSGTRVMQSSKYQCHMAASCTYHLPTIISSTRNKKHIS